MDIARFMLDGSKKFNPKQFNPSCTEGVKDKIQAKQQLAENIEKMAALQNVLYAEGRQALLVAVQAMDAAGKDSTIKYVFSGINPQGVQVTSFKQPSTTELEHDYLWRVHAAMPARGMIGVFNRSHYEEVLVAKVLNLPKTQKLPAYALKNIWQKRYRQIRDYEQYLTENGIAIVKIHLRISKDEQARRFLARLDNPAKNWKFALGDVTTRERWDDYMKAYKEAIDNTATPCAPWYVVPANKKWYARLLVSEIVLKTLKTMHPAYPKVKEEQKQQWEQCRTLLNRELPPNPKEKAAVLEETTEKNA